MAVQPVSLESTFNAMHERAIRLEHEAAALRSDLDAMSVLMMWQTQHRVTPEVLQRIAVRDDEIAAYQKNFGAQFPAAVLRAVFQAQKAATRLKLSLPVPEREAAILAVIDALEQVAAQQQLTIPAELEAVVGD